MINSVHFLAMVSGDTHPQLPEMEGFTERYPWCGLGHKLLFEALCAAGPEVSASYASKASVYLYNRAALYALAHAPVRPLTPSPSSEKEKNQEIFEMIPETEIPLVMMGGDYFGKQEMAVAPLEENDLIDRFIKTNPRLVPQPSTADMEEKVSLLDVEEDEFMTETLAKIYEDQGLYSLAMEAYGKLILLYPKKSTYFASLIQDIKLKINR
jgi:hypothetical protein